MNPEVSTFYVLPTYVLLCTLNTCQTTSSLLPATTTWIIDEGPSKQTMYIFFQVCLNIVDKLEENRQYCT